MAAMGKRHERGTGGAAGSRAEASADRAGASKWVVGRIARVKTARVSYRTPAERLPVDLKRGTGAAPSLAPVVKEEHAGGVTPINWFIRENIHTTQSPLH
jgi:hypothetical protein